MNHYDTPDRLSRLAEASRRALTRRSTMRSFLAALSGVAAYAATGRRMTDGQATVPPTPLTEPAIVLSEELVSETAGSADPTASIDLPTLSARSGRVVAGQAGLAQAQSSTYVVKPGDTVNQIAASLGVNPQEIVDLNPALQGNRNWLVVGQVIVLPGGTTAPSASAGPTLSSRGGETPTPTATPSSTPTPTRATPALPAGLPAYQSSFLTKAIEPAKQSMQETGVPASVTLAQAALESDWGRSLLATQGQNYFGIKASAKPGPAGVIYMNTYEAGIGYVNAPFRKYHNMEESFVDHGLFFTENARYAGAMAVRDNAKEFARAIHRAGYATDPSYSTKLISYMTKFNLEAYDKP